eukprot:2799097-Amphidinium_carterae.1
MSETATKSAQSVLFCPGRFFMKGDRMGGLSLYLMGSASHRAPYLMWILDVGGERDYIRGSTAVATSRTMTKAFFLST